MEELLGWVAGIENRAWKTYGEAARYFEKDHQLRDFLELIADHESLHFKILRSAADRAGNFPEFGKPAISVDQGTDKRINDYFDTIEGKIASSTLTMETMLEIVAEVETSEWNDIFLYVLSLLKLEQPRFPYPSVEIQRHKKLILNFFENHLESGHARLASLKKLPDVWVENILIVDDEPSIRDIYATVLGREWGVDVASNGFEALDLIEKKYYKLIITDLGMPLISGVDLYKTAVQKHPELADRFLFITGDASEDDQRFLDEKSAPVLLKPITLQELRTTTLELILRTSTPGEVDAATDRS